MAGLQNMYTDMNTSNVSTASMGINLLVLMMLVIISDTVPFTDLSFKKIGTQIHAEFSRTVAKALKVESQSDLVWSSGRSWTLLPQWNTAIFPLGSFLQNMKSLVPTTWNQTDDDQQTHSALNIWKLLALRVLILWFCAQCSFLHIPGLVLFLCFMDCTLNDIVIGSKGDNPFFIPFAEQFDADKLLRFSPFLIILLWPNFIGFGAFSPLQVMWSLVVLRSFWTEWSSTLSASSPVHSKMNYLKMSFLEYCWAFCSLGGSATLGWIMGVIRKYVVRQNQESTDTEMEHALHRMLTESMLVIGITEGDDEEFTSTFSVMMWPERTKKVLQIKCRWDEPVVLSVLSDEKVISMEDAIVMLSVHRVYSIHTKVHAMANWAFLGEQEFPGRSESVLYNHFGTVTFKKLCGFWSHFSGFDHREYFELLVQDSMNEHFKHPLTFLSFKHKSRIIHFLAEAREAVMDIFRPLGMNRRQMEGIYGVTILHSLDHYTMGTSLDPMILVNATTTLPEMCDFVTFTECGFVHETPLLLGSYRLSTLKQKCFQELSKRLIEIDSEFGNQIDFAIVQ